METLLAAWWNCANDVFLIPDDNNNHITWWSSWSAMIGLFLISLNIIITFSTPPTTVYTFYPFQPSSSLSSLPSWSQLSWSSWSWSWGSSCLSPLTCDTLHTPVCTFYPPQPSPSTRLPGCISSSCSPSDPIIKSKMMMKKMMMMMMSVTSIKVSLPKQEQASSPLIFLHLSNSTEINLKFLNKS